MAMTQSSGLLPPKGNPHGSAYRATNMRRLPPQQTAFTLLEILIVLGILVLLSGIAWPVLANRITAAELPESANQVRDMLFMARAEAALEHRRYRIRFAPNEQQPHIEYEPDPILRPGEWAPVTSPWAAQPVLLADIQIHDIQPGRPIWLDPLAIDEDPQQKQQDKLDKQKVEEAKPIDATSAQSAIDNGDEEIDENRPSIIFQPDGSADWATIILARIPLDEPINDDQKQRWVILDARTGLAHVREKITEEQLADPEFYIQRDKLELPELNIDNLAIETGDGSQTRFSGGSSSGGAGRQPGNSQGLDSPPNQQNGQNGARASSPASETGTDPRNQGPGLDPNNSDQGTGRDGDPGRDNNTSDTQNPNNLDQALENSDLTEEERANIRRTLGPGRGG